MFKLSFIWIRKGMKKFEFQIYIMDPYTKTINMHTQMIKSNILTIHNASPTTGFTIHVMKTIENYEKKRKYSRKRTWEILTNQYLVQNYLLWIPIDKYIWMIPFAYPSVFQEYMNVYYNSYTNIMKIVFREYEFFQNLVWENSINYSFQTSMKTTNKQTSGVAIFL